MTVPFDLGLLHWPKSKPNNRITTPATTKPLMPLSQHQTMPAPIARKMIPNSLNGASKHPLIQYLRLVVFYSLRLTFHVDVYRPYPKIRAEQIY
jgi:hypothetical protein